MADKSKIQWTDATWNVARGCSKVDADCKFCYMYRESMNGTRYSPIEVKRTKTVFTLPLKIKEPSKIFTSSLTDFFHSEIDNFRNDAWEIIRKCSHHKFQILTKRPERIMKSLPDDWNEGYDNVWLGVSVGSNNGIHRINQLLTIPSKIKFISFEPLYEDLVFDLSKEQLNQIDWIIIGGESGNENGKYKYRPCEVAWIENIIEKFKGTNTKIFIKQMGTFLSKELKMSDRHGTKIEDFPSNLQIREFPE